MTVQGKGFPLAGLLSNVMVQDLVKLSLNLTKPHIPHWGMMTNDDIGNPEKPESHEVKAGITMPANASSSFSRRGDAGSFVTSTRTRVRGFSEAIKMDWTAPTTVDKFCPHDEACSKASGLTPPR